MDQLEDTPLPSNLAAVVAELIGELDGLAPLLQSCKCDPNAALQYDMLADALYWSDEYPAALPCDAAFRYLLRYRTMVIMNESANSTLQELWN